MKNETCKVRVKFHPHFVASSLRWWWWLWKWWCWWFSWTTVIQTRPVIKRKDEKIIKNLFQNWGCTAVYAWITFYFNSDSLLSLATIVTLECRSFVLSLSGKREDNDKGTETATVCMRCILRRCQYVDCVAPNGETTHQLERIWRNRSWPKRGAIASCTLRDWETHENPQNDQCPNLDSNRASPE
jgi:hypothetical protein